LNVSNRRHASVIQESALGPASFIVTASDLHLVHDGNRIFTFLIWTRARTRSNICKRGRRIMTRRRRSLSWQVESERHHRRVRTSSAYPCRLRVLGIIMNERLTAADHVTMLLSSSSSLMYAMRVLRAHGTPTAPLHDIFQATLQLFLRYSTRCHCGWECVRQPIARVDSLLLRGKWLGYCADDVPTVADLFNTADDDFFHRVKTISHHVLQPHLPDQTDIPYQLRIRSHNMSLINKTKFLNDADFIIRLIYKYSY